jgi:hypothetical protein
MPLPENLNSRQVVGFLRNSLKLKMQAMNIVIREVGVECLAVANEAYRQQQEARQPRKKSYI